MSQEEGSDVEHLRVSSLKSRFEALARQHNAPQPSVGSSSESSVKKDVRSDKAKTDSAQLASPNAPRSDVSSPSASRASSPSKDNDATLGKQRESDNHDPPRGADAGKLSLPEAAAPLRPLSGQRRRPPPPPPSKHSSNPKLKNGSAPAENTASSSSTSVSSLAARFSSPPSKPASPKPQSLPEPVPSVPVVVQSSSSPPNVQEMDIPRDRTDEPDKSPFGDPPRNLSESPPIMRTDSPNPRDEQRAPSPSSMRPPVPPRPSVTSPPAQSPIQIVPPPLPSRKSPQPNQSLPLPSMSSQQPSRRDLSSSPSRPHALSDPGALSVPYVPPPPPIRNRSPGSVSLRRPSVSTPAANPFDDSESEDGEDDNSVSGLLKKADEMPDATFASRRAPAFTPERVC
jgi:hypothetical protein